jgi:hypothetical protein
MDQLNWIKIHKTTSQFEATLIQRNLENNDIPCVIMNKKDSSYLAFGYLEIMVPEQYTTEAKELINNNSENE